MILTSTVQLHTVTINGQDYVPAFVARDLEKELEAFRGGPHGFPHNLRPVPGLTLERIAGAVCFTFRLAHDTLTGRRRAAPVSEARQAAMFLSRALTSSTFMKIGAYYRRDHGTVIHAVKAVPPRLERFMDYRAKVVAAYDLLTD